MAHVDIWVDGSSLGNPGNGGYGCLMICEEKGLRKEFADGYLDVTNNQMELLAPIIGLSKLSGTNHTVSIHSDSQYTIDCMTKWYNGWKKKGMRTGAGKPVKNVELVEKLHALCEIHNPTWVKVKAHSGIPDNEVVDKLAKNAAELAENDFDVTNL